MAEFNFEIEEGQIKREEEVTLDEGIFAAKLIEPTDEEH
jgi:hypothetical protein